MHKVFDNNEVIRVLKMLCQRLEITAINEKTVSDALKRRTSDFEDTVQYISALPYQPDVILTRDKRGFDGLGLPVMTPAEFVAESHK
jgi:hypothetical protein